MAKVLLMLLLGGSFAFGFAFAQEEECPPPQPVPECLPSETYTCDSETQYQCESDACGAGVQTRTKSYQCQDFYKPKEATDLGCPGIYECIIDSTKVVAGPSYDTGQTIPGQQFKQCTSGSGWSSSFEFQCQGKCYPEPEIQSLNEPTLSPKNVFDGLGKIKLPLNIGWKNNVEQQLSFSGAACKVSSYEYKVKQSNSVAASGKVSGSSHSSLVGESSCTLNPNSSYNLEVRACAGNTCSNPGTLSFSTSPAPQLLYPYDSDWEDKENAFGDIPATLAWCPAPGVHSFLHQIYKDQVSKQNLVWDNVEDSSVTSYEDLDAQVLQKDTTYFWRIAPCTSSNISSCGIFSQLWSFVPTGAVLSAPQLHKPFYTQGSQVPAVNLRGVLEWQGDPFTPFFYVEVGNGLLFNRFIEHTTTPTQLPFSEFWHWLDLSTTYQWKVWACSSNTLVSCEGESEAWQFKTTGEPPAQFDISPREPGGTRIALPATFTWNSVPGAASYQVQFGEKQSYNVFHTKNPSLLIDYPTLAPNPDGLYLWRVKTCADSAGTICGDWSSDQSFKFAPLKAPTIKNPTLTQTEFSAKNTSFAWTRDFGNNYFAYQLHFLGPIPEEKSPSCQTPHPVLTEALTQETSATIRLRCLGEYKFDVAGCVDKACEARGAQATQEFTVEKFTGKAGGFAVCDANNNNPATPYNELDPCELKHLVLLIRNLIDFALWKLSLIILIAMTAFTGFTMYTSFGGMEVMAKVRSIWKAVGIGFLILLFSWLLLNLFLGIVGFQVNIFGKWHELGI